MLDLGRAAVDVHRAAFEEIDSDGVTVRNVVVKAVVTAANLDVASGGLDLALLRKGQNS